MARKLARVPIHPGEILREEFMLPLNLSINALARALHVQPMRISEIVNERRGISADTALRLARYFSSSAEFWLNMQAAYELDLASQNADKIAREVQPRVA